MGRIPQGITNRTHRRAETEDERIQDSHSQPHASSSTLFLRGAYKHRAVAPRPCRPEPRATFSPRWRRSEQLSRPRGCSCSAGSFHLAVEVSFRFARHPAWYLPRVDTIVHIPVALGKTLCGFSNRSDGSGSKSQRMSRTKVGLGCSSLFKRVWILVAQQLVGPQFIQLGFEVGAEQVAFGLGEFSNRF